MASDTALLRLASDWAPADGAGTLRFVLSNSSDLHLDKFQLAFTSLFPLVVEDQQLEGAHLVKQVSNYHLIRPPDSLTLPQGAHWSFSAQVGRRLQHYTSAVKSAYVILDDGGTIAVVSLPTTRGGEPGAPKLGLPPSSRLPSCEPAIALVPFPANVQVAGAREPANVLCLVDGPAEAAQAFRAAAGLSERLFRAEPPLFTQGGDIECVARHTPGPDPEGYAIEFAPDAVAVHACGPAGFLYAFISLGQILRAARLDRAQFRFPARGEIRDRPRFEWRGMLLDVARQVFSQADLSWMVDCLAWHKFNRLHLHLSDDEGWRLDIPAVPQLAELGGWRGHGLAVPPGLGSGAERCGMIYSGADIGRLVRRALELSVTIVPEIDMPGHSQAALEALPDLRDPADCGKQRDILNPAVRGTYDYVQAVVGELVRVFPSPWIHIGGDEVPADAWAGSPLAKRMMEESGWQDPYQLQSCFLRRVQAIVRAHGRRTGAWQEAAFGGGIDPADCYLVAWRKAESGLDLAQRGYNVVLAPAQAYYLDMAQSEDWWEPGMDWAGAVSAEQCYRYDPGGDWPDALKARLLGVQACLWSENLHDRRIFARLTIPRVAAVAESAWSAPGSKSFARFAAMYHLLPPTGIR